MRAVTDNNDPRVAMPSPSIDPVSHSGRGTREHSYDTGASIKQRKMMVAITSPERRHQEGAGRHEQVNKDLLTTRRTDVMVRSGNTNMRSGVDSNLPDENYYEARGLADEQSPETKPLFQRVPPALFWGAVALGVIAVYQMASDPRLR